MATELEELAGKLQARRDALHELSVKAGPDIKMTEREVEEFKTLRAEIDDLGKTFLEKKSIADDFARNDRDRSDFAKATFNVGRPSQVAADPADHPQSYKTLGTQFVESAEYKGGMKQGRYGTAEIKSYADPRYQDTRYMTDAEYKTNMTLAAGFAPPNFRTSKIVLTGTETPRIADLIPNTLTELQTVKWMAESTFTNNVAAALEGAAGTDSALAYTETSVAMRKIMGWLPVTDEQLDDVPSIRSLIDNRLQLQYGLAEETELLFGEATGTLPHLRGFLNAASLQTQALGADPIPDAIYKAITKIRWGAGAFANPSGIVMHPTDWQYVQLLRTADGLYIWGNPSTPYQMPTMWGLPVVLSTNMTATGITGGTIGTALVGDFTGYSEIFRRYGAEIEVSNSHASNFTLGIKVIKITGRLALAIYRGQAFCTVTGLPAS